MQIKFGENKKIWDKFVTNSPQGSILPYFIVKYQGIDG